MGERIPWIQMGYSKLDDFVDQNPQLFKIEYKMDGPWVKAVASEETQHIKNMVSAQRNKSRRAKPKPARRPMRMTNWVPPVPYGTYTPTPQRLANNRKFSENFYVRDRFRIVQNVFKNENIDFENFSH